MEDIYKFQHNLCTYIIKRFQADYNKLIDKLKIIVVERNEKITGEYREFMDLCLEHQNRNFNQCLQNILLYIEETKILEYILTIPNLYHPDLERYEKKAKENNFIEVLKYVEETKRIKFEERKLMDLYQEEKKKYQSDQKTNYNIIIHKEEDLQNRREKYIKEKQECDEETIKLHFLKKEHNEKYKDGIRFQ